MTGPAGEHDGRSAARFLHDDVHHVDSITRELADGLRALDGLGPAVSVFGSARTPAADPAHAHARAVARTLAAGGFAVLTGGGGGLMEAACLGVRDAGGRAIGLTIEPEAAHEPPYLDLNLRLRHFLVRKILFLRCACAFVVLPGGFGTLDELFEVLALIQLRRVTDFPVILCGTDYWAGLLAWLREVPLARAAISEADLGLVHLAAEPGEVLEIVAAAAAAQRIAPGRQ